MDNNVSVMVIEDEELLLKAIVTKLESKHITPIPFMNAREAIEYLKTNDRIPDAIWLDYYLKDMSGLDFMHEIKGEEKLKNIPVIVVSNSANPEKVHKMLALGAKQYFLKAQHRLSDIVDTMHDIISDMQKTKDITNKS